MEKGDGYSTSITKRTLGEWKCQFEKLRVVTSTAIRESCTKVREPRRKLRNKVRLSKQARERGR
jgi:hypothetical protein